MVETLNTQTGDELLTVAEVATALKLNQQTIRNWIDAGSLPAVRIGRRVRIRRTDIEAMIQDAYSGERVSPTRASLVPSYTADAFWAGQLPSGSQVLRPSETAVDGE